MLKKIIIPENNKALLIAILCVLSAGVYLNTCNNRFAFDDVSIVLNDHRIRTIRSLPSLFTNDYWMLPNTNLYRPLPLLSMAGNYFISGESPWSYHLFNLLLHTLNVVLLFIFLGNFYKERPGFRFLAAAIFAVHPAATEAVNLIVGRAELLAFTFSLAAFHLHINRERGRRCRYGSFFLFFLAMMSKENAMMLPLFLLLYHAYFEERKIAAVLKDMLGYAAVLLVFLAIRWSVVGAFGPKGVGLIFNGIPWKYTAFTMVKALALYWQTVFWPAGIQAYYDLNDIPIPLSLYDTRVLTSLALLIAAFAAVFWTLRRDRVLSYFILWPFVAFIPVMNIVVPTGVLFAIRVMYLPMAGFSVVLAAFILLPQTLLERIRPAERSRTAICLLIPGACLLTLSVLTIIRNTDWKDDTTLFKKELLLSPRSEYAMESLLHTLPPDAALVMVKRILALDALNFFALASLGDIYEKQGDHAAAEEQYRRSLALQADAKTHRSLGVLLSGSGRLDEAEQQFRKAIQLKPYWSNAYEDLAIVLLKKGEVTAALEMSQKALSINPDSALAYNLIGTCYKETGAYAEAIRAFRKAVALAPQFYEAMYNLANATEKVDPAMAVRAWQEYIQVAEGAVSEAAWVADARKHLAALSGESRQD